MRQSGMHPILNVIAQFENFKNPPMFRILYILLSLFPFFFACQSTPQPKPQPSKLERYETYPRHTYQPQVFTPYSQLKNDYKNFDSPKAINRLADIENEYFNQLAKGDYSQYYGTEWRKIAEKTPLQENFSQYDEYVEKLKAQNKRPDSLHCTLYAYEGLKAGLDSIQLADLEKQHKAIWKDREIAGWSIGYLLVKNFGWKAYLILHPHSPEYDLCQKTYQKTKSYPVWRQPNIPLENIFIEGKDDSLIQKLLKKHEFSWGFSEQGIHTWITRFDMLKECYWEGVPSNKYKIHPDEKPLFLQTPFLEYRDYDSHVLIFPDK